MLLVAAGWAAAVTGCAKVDTPGAGGEGGSAGMRAGSDGMSASGGTSGRDAAPQDMAPPKPPCVGLQCQQMVCPGGGTTSVSGTVFAPNGKLPLYNVMVYVPNAPLDPLKAGVSCDRCGMASGHPIASAISNEQGKFTIKNVPVGKNIPLVVQVGK